MNASSGVDVLLLIDKMGKIKRKQDKWVETGGKFATVYCLVGHKTS